MYLVIRREEIKTVIPEDNNIEISIINKGNILNNDMSKV